MPDYSLYTKEAAIAKQGIIKTSLTTTSKVRLIKAGITLDENTTRQQCIDNEANFDGYPAGGITLAAWHGPVAIPGGGMANRSPLATFTYGPAAPTPVVNVIIGYWIEDASPAARVLTVYDPPRNMAAVTDVIDILQELVEGRNEAPPVE